MVPRRLFVNVEVVVRYPVLATFTVVLAASSALRCVSSVLGHRVRIGHVWRVVLRKLTAGNILACEVRGPETDVNTLPLKHKSVQSRLTSG